MSIVTWETVIEEEKKKAYLADTIRYIAQQRNEDITIYPNDKNLFSAFSSTPFERVRVVILGQDPYHGQNQAHGLCFSVLPGEKVPPSLRNIYKELQNDIDDFEVPNHGYLQSWADQGVLLLNTVLSVEAGKAHSHKSLGWEQFTDVVINQLNELKESVVFMLWGAHAQKKGKTIDRNRHHVLESAHPSPLSAHRGFLGCRHFSKVNRILKKTDQAPIDWSSVCRQK